jgi:pilus assembly protein CpaB
VAGGVAWVVYEVVGTYQSQVAFIEGAYDERTVEVLSMKAELGPGTTITEEHLELVEMGIDYVPLSVLRRPEDVIGRVTKERLLPGDLLRRERLAPVGAGQGLNAIVPEGMRALGLNLSSDDQVSGFIEPGNFVDLLATLPDDENREAETITLLQATRVLAVDEKISVTASGEIVKTPQITLAVSPDLAEKVTHVMAEATPKLTLRTDIDVHHRETNGTMSSDLLGTEQTRMSVTQYRESFDEDAVTDMLEIIHGHDKKRERAVSPEQLKRLELVGFD